MAHLSNPAAVDLARRLGMRRVTRVRIVDDGAHLRAEADGVVHRLPRTVRIPVSTATALAAAGVPLVVDDVSDRVLVGRP